MLNPYLEKFNQALNQGQTLRPVLEEVLKQYQADKPDQGSQVISKILSWPHYWQLRNLSNTELGKSPEDLKKLLTVAQLREQTLLEARPFLIRDCENEAAAAGHSAEVIFKQTLRLETALFLKQVLPRDIDEVEEKIGKWYFLLYEKFAELILQAKDLEILKNKVSIIFNKNHVSHPGAAQVFCTEVSDQVEYLEKEKFFENYYKKTDLSEKYNYVYDTYQTFKSAEDMDPELKYTLTHLLEKIVKQAFQTYEKKKHSLMTSEGTFRDIYDQLAEWKQSSWHRWHGTDLKAALEEQFSLDKTKDETWAKIYALESGSSPEKIKTNVSLYKLHCMKYSRSPNEDPKQLLARFIKN